MVCGWMWLVWLAAGRGLAPLLGALSDVAGRKWFFIACIIGTALPSLVLSFTPRAV